MQMPGCRHALPPPCHKHCVAATFWSPPRSRRSLVPPSSGRARTLIPPGTQYRITSSSPAAAHAAMQGVAPGRLSQRTCSGSIVRELTSEGGNPSRSRGCSLCMARRPTCIDNSPPEGERAEARPKGARGHSIIPWTQQGTTLSTAAPRLDASSAALECWNAPDQLHATAAVDGEKKRAIQGSSIRTYLLAHLPR